MAQEIKITRNLKVGALDAETDADLLDKCFLDKGDIGQLSDVNNPLAVVLGRTGSGKSALLYRLSKTVNRSRKLDPNDISIRFLEHSDIIRFFSSLGVNLDLFYRILWRHILTVELLKLRYDIKNERDGNNFVNNIFNSLTRDKAKRKAIDYFNEWGDRFWLDTDEQLKEITTKLEADTRLSIGAEYAGLRLSADEAKKLTDQQRIEVSQRASQVVNGLQIKRLNEVLDLLAEHSFDDPQKTFFIMIDQLDEEWASTDTRCRFIRALIEEIKTFRKLRNVKIIAALRKDLLELVFDRTRDSGFQEEKYEAYILELRWSPDELKRLVELRINEVFRSQYTKENVSLADVFPKSVKGGGQTPVDFIIERTLRRPRDVLQFVNESFVIASERNRVSWRALQAAEAQYSVKRMKSLREEWSEIHPSLEDSMEVLRGSKSTFSRSHLSQSRIEDVIMTLYNRNNNDPCVEIAKAYFDNKGASESDVVAAILACLYKVGALGIKISTLDSFVWSHIDQATVSKGEIKRSNQVKVHKMLYRALEVVVEKSEIFESDDA